MLPSEIIQHRYPPGIIDEEVSKYLEYLERIGPLQYEEYKPEEIRRIIEEFTISYRRSKHADAVENKIDETINEIPVRYYMPKDTGPFPLLIYFHGGGWVFGSLDAYDHLCQNIANRAQCMVCSVGYHLAPEHMYPFQLHEALKVVSWLFEHVDDLQVDPTHISIGGDSAGGNLSAAISWHFRDDQLCSLRSQVLFYPLLNASSQDTNSYQQYGYGYGLTKTDLQWFIQQYVPEKTDRFNPMVSPLLATDVAQLPSTIIVTAEFDPLRDEAEQYAMRLYQEKIPITCIRYNGLIHGFLLSDGIFTKVDMIITELCQILKSLM